MLQREFVNEETGERALFALVVRKRRVYKSEIDYIGHLSPAQRRRKRAIEAETEWYWKQVE